MLRTLSSIIPAQPFVKEGKLRGLAVTGRTRSPALPEVPTMMESGLANYEATAWFGVLVPVGTPRAIIAKLNGEIGHILRLHEVREKLSSLGAEAGGGTSEEFAAYIKAEISKWGKVAREVGIKPE